MKASTFSIRFSLILFVAAVFISCETTDVSGTDDFLLSNELSVTTLNPEVRQNDAILHGRILGMGGNTSVAYGFIYFDQFGNINHRIEVGRTETPIEYSLQTVTLPGNSDYTVCTFVEVPRENVLGEEVSFFVP